MRRSFNGRGEDIGRVNFADIEAWVLFAGPCLRRVALRQQWHGEAAAEGFPRAVALQGPHQDGTRWRHQVFAGRRLLHAGPGGDAGSERADEAREGASVPAGDAGAARAEPADGARLARLLPDPRSVSYCDRGTFGARSTTVALRNFI